MATTESSAYMLIFRDTSPETYEAMEPGQRRACLDDWNGWYDRLAAQGTLHSGHPLQPEGRMVSRGRRVTDGPYAEAKEVVGGFFLVYAASLDQATDIAEQCPLLPYGMTVEVRPVAGGCHLATSLGWETMREPAAA